MFDIARMDNDVFARDAKAVIKRFFAAHVAGKLKRPFLVQRATGDRVFIHVQRHHVGQLAAGMGKILQIVEERENLIAAGFFQHCQRAVIIEIDMAWVLGGIDAGKGDIGRGLQVEMQELRVDRPDDLVTLAHEPARDRDGDQDIADALNLDKPYFHGRLDILP